MLNLLSILYGVHLVLLIYLVSFLSARGLVKGGVIPVLVTLGKYFIYYVAITFGFKHLPVKGLLIGFVGGLYLSLIGLCIVYLLLERRKTDKA